MPLSDKDYKARWDAETLASAKEIEADPTRLSKAKTAAQSMADDEAKKTKHLRQVAGRKPRENGVGSGQPNTLLRTNRNSNRNGSGVGSFNVFKKI